MFDGVHLGHQAIIQRMLEVSRPRHLSTLVITFHPHPAVVLRGKTGTIYLTLPEERVQLLGELGVDGVFVLPFDQDMAATSARDFVARLKKHLRMKMLCVGPDFALGRGREGNLPVLRQLGAEMAFDVQVIDSIRFSEGVISSSQIRALLEAGNVSRAAALLGRPYRLSGEVIPGDQRGRTIGFPTANLRIPEGKLVPANGVYACRARLGEAAWAAAINIGVRPTFDGQGNAVHVEAYLLDFKGNLYGQELMLEFIEYLRGEVRFPSIQALVEQIRLDVESTRRIFENQAERSG